MSRADELGAGARFRYDMMNNVTRFVFDEPDGSVVVKEYRPEYPNDLIRVADPHPKGLWTYTAREQSIRAGLRDSDDVARDLIRLFEDESVPKRYLGAELFGATVKYEDQTLDVEINVFDRKLVRVSQRVKKFASEHAISRAKQRYNLILDAETAEAMVNLMKAGQYVPTEGARGDRIRAELTYDTEVFTVVYAPETEMIITITPTGAYDESLA